MVHCFSEDRRGGRVDAAGFAVSFGTVTYPNRRCGRARPACQRTASGRDRRSYLAPQAVVVAEQPAFVLGTLAAVAPPG
jgi:hypothetical protein